MIMSKYRQVQFFGKTSSQGDTSHMGVDSAPHQRESYEWRQFNPDHEQRQDIQETYDDSSLITVGNNIIFAFVHKLNMNIKDRTHKILSQTHTEHK